MEDQRPAAGDLTDESEGDATAETDAAETEVERPEADAGEAENVESAGDTETAAEDTETADEAGEEGEEGQEPTADTAGRVRVRRPAGKRLAAAAILAAALFVGAGAFAGANVQPYLKDRATVATKLKIARTAATAITTLWTYTPDNMDKLADRAAQYLSGDFEASYRKYIDAIVAPNKQAQITNTTQVTGAAVESLDATNATAIVYTNTTSTTPSTKDMPALKYLSYRLTMKRDHARWLVTRMTTITTLDLTPKF